MYIFCLKHRNSRLLRPTFSFIRFRLILVRVSVISASEIVFF